MRRVNRFFYYLFNKPSVLLLILLEQISPIIPDRIYLEIRYRIVVGKKLNLNAPKTFSEKLQWLKLYNRKPEYTIMVDKVRAKEYVAAKLGKEFVIPTLGVWDNPDEIDFSALPDKFVLKCNHNSGNGMYICRKKSKMNIVKVKTGLRKGLKENYFLHGREWPYKDVPRKVLAEKYLNEAEYEDLRDYKFFCFNGEPVYCQVISGRDSVMTVDFFDGNWKHQPFHEPAIFPFSKEVIDRPENYELMKDLARKLAIGLPFVRIDFYNIHGKIYFGEITFFPTSGMGGFDPNEWDLRFGDMISIGDVTNRDNS